MQSAFWAVARGVVSLTGIGVITRAYLLADANHVAVVEYAVLISAGVWSYVHWGEPLDATGIIGIALIVAAWIVIILQTREPT